RGCESHTREPDLHRRHPRHKESGALGLGDDEFLAGEDRLEGSLQPTVSVLQCLDAPRDDIVLLEHLLHRVGLLAGKLSVDIGHEQFVAELGHDDPLPPCGKSAAMLALPWDWAVALSRSAK